MHYANSADDKLMIFFIFHPVNKVSDFMQTISTKSQKSIEMFKILGHLPCSVKSWQESTADLESQ